MFAMPRDLYSDQIYTVPQVAVMFGVSPARIRHLAARGRIRGAVRPGHEWVIFHGAEIIQPEVETDPTGTTGAIWEYLEECKEEDVPATIPPPWWKEEIDAD